VRPAGEAGLGTKTELKNMNSFRFLERGIDAELARQTALLDDGGRVVQETLHFDPDTGEIHSLRSKEEAHDYRYFPEPDLVPLAPDRAWVERLRAGLPELPSARRGRWQELGLTFEDAEVLSETGELGDYFERVAGLAEPKAAANWIRGELRAQLREAGQEPWESQVTPELLAELIGLREDGTLSEPGAKEVLAEVVRTGASPAAVVEERGLGQISDDGELTALVEQLLADNPDQAEQLRGGKDKLVGYFVGQAMKATGGRADPARVGQLVREKAAG
jgi:aspartyl-tRNA(Asn)/glutamyl-tRNA(Gln) amidotransferase subunit B